MTPALRTTRCHEGQPVGRNRGVKKCDREPCKRNGSEDGFVHALTPRV